MERGVAILYAPLEGRNGPSLTECCVRLLGWSIDVHHESQIVEPQLRMRFGFDEIEADDVALSQLVAKQFTGNDDWQWLEAKAESYIALCNKFSTDVVKSLDKTLKLSTFLGGTTLSRADVAVYRSTMQQIDVLISNLNSGETPHFTRWLRMLHNSATQTGIHFKCSAEAQALLLSEVATFPKSTSSSHTVCVESEVISSPQSISPSNSGGGSNFIRQIVDEDLKTGKHKFIITRFPPEPNGFLHLGHAKSVYLNFGLAERYNGKCNLRFDDTNPSKEDSLYIESIIEDVRWLGGDFGEPLYASDYFNQLYEWALDLIKKGLAYIDDQSEHELRKNRGDLKTPGVDSPYRTRSVEENLKLFEDMKSGSVPEGKHVLRAKIDMTSGNMNLRDPLMYRVKHHSHPRTGNKWCIYPMYDFAHGQEDSIEGITHSICTLEFEDHRPLYEWYQEKLGIFKTQQIEFARLNVTGTVMSKRKLLQLVETESVMDWDDPRMPTICGMRRRGYPAAALRDFCERVGVAKRDTTMKMEYLEVCVRENLSSSPRRFAVLSPLRVVITNFPESGGEVIEVPNHPDLPEMGNREIKFGRLIYIDRDDFMELPNSLFHRLSVGNEVRLRYAYWIKCNEIIKNPHTGEIEELHCTYDPSTKGCNTPTDGRKVKATIHWLRIDNAIKIQARIFEPIFPDSALPDTVDTDVVRDVNITPPTGLSPLSAGSTVEGFNPTSLQVRDSFAEKSCSELLPGDTVQFERLGYFTLDKQSDVMLKYRGSLVTTEVPVFNRTVTLVDSYIVKAASEGNAQRLSKEAEKAARQRAVDERQKKKDERFKRQQDKKANEAAAV